MPRHFVDAAGVRWQVRAVEPQLAERRTQVRRLEAEGAQLLERRRDVERRRVEQVRAPVTPGFEHGWLTFESRGEKRRLAPVPRDWERLDDSGLRVLLGRARPVPGWGQRPA